MFWKKKEKARPMGCENHCGYHGISWNGKLRCPECQDEADALRIVYDLKPSEIATLTALVNALGQQLGRVETEAKKAREAAVEATWAVADVKTLLLDGERKPLLNRVAGSVDALTTFVSVLPDIAKALALMNQRIDYGNTITDHIYDHIGVGKRRRAQLPRKKGKR